MNTTIKTTTIVIALLILFSANTFASLFEDGMSAYNNGDYATALRLFRLAADQGDAASQNSLGYFYNNGLGGLPQDYVEAVKWYTKSADQDYAEAQFNLALLYEDGLGVPQSENTAFHWYAMAIGHGHVGAKANLGSLFLKRGYYQDAFKYLKQAAEQGNAVAQNNLGSMYNNGKGINPDFQEAVKWTRMSAKQGYPTAQYNLAMMLITSFFGNQNEAKQWLKTAAQGNDPKIAGLAQKELNKLVSDDAARKQYDRQIEIDDHEFKCGTYIAGGASYGELAAMGCN